MFVYFCVNVLDVLFVVKSKVLGVSFLYNLYPGVIVDENKIRANNYLLEKCCFKNVWMAAYNDYDLKLCYQTLTFYIDGHFKERRIRKFALIVVDCFHKEYIYIIEFN